MKRNHTQTFTRDDGTQVICATDANGQRLPTRYLRPDGTEAKPADPPAKKPPRRIEAKRTFGQKAATFARSAARHVAAGMPQATDEQVAERFAICQACPHFAAKGEGQGECAKCGCGLKAVGVSGLNKLRWADESCPVVRWKALPPAPGGATVPGTAATPATGRGEVPRP